MTKIEFLSASLPYGLKCEDIFDCVWTIHPYKDTLDTLNDNEHLSFESFIKENEAAPNTHKLIVRHLDDLVKECVQADYNNGEPFVPIVELLENSYFNTSIMPRAEIMSFAHSFSRIELITLNALSLYLKWHFDLITEPCEKVYVTDEFNPYISNYDNRRN